MNHEHRLDRLEAVVHILAEDQLKTEDAIRKLATETKQRFEQVAKQSAETDQRMDRMRTDMEQMRKDSLEEFRQLRQELRENARYFDERVDKLVVAIGQMIARGQPGPV